MRFPVIVGGAVVCLFWLVCLTFDARGQTFTGSIVGRVLDSQQAAVPKASVSLRSVERDFERQTTTNSQGEYSFELVPPGKFTIRVEASGFAVSLIGIEVVVASPVRGDLTLGIQPLPQEMKVLGESGVSVETENGSLGYTVSPHQMSDLPSLARSPYDFIALMPGAVVSNDAIGVGFAVNGGRTQSGSFLLDGAENNEAFMSTVALDIPLDSVEEFKVQTNHYSAEYGRNSAFTANIVTKGGTKELRGSLYDYIRNSALAANTFDNNAQGLPRPVFNRHQFGGTIGGPIRQRRLFFFTSVEPILVRSSGPNPFVVPTPDLLTISAPGTQAIFEHYPLPNSLSSTNVHRLTVCPYGSSCDARTNAGFVDIPAFAFTSRIGPQDAGASFPQNTILTTGRLDWVINSKMQAFARYGFENKDEFASASQPYSRKLDVPQFARNQNIALNLIRIWSPNWATESHIVYSRILGDPDRFTGSNPVTPNPPIPVFSIQNQPDVTLPFGSESFGGPENFYQFSQTATWALGRHALGFGNQFVHLRDNRSYGIGQVGDATFSDTQGFVDGILASYSIALSPKGHFPGEFVDPPLGPPSFTRHYRYNEPAFFVADTWKFSSRLTLTPGLRWEYFGVFHSPDPEQQLDSNFYPGSGSNLAEQVARGRFLRTVDAPGDLRGRFYLPDFKNFAPRLGVAYDIFGDGKTVIRSGAGIFYDRRVGWELFRAILNPPAYSLVLLSDVPVTPGLLGDPYAAFPDAAIKLDKSVTQDPATNMRTSSTVSWNVTVERELSSTLVFGASYLGSSGSKLYSISNVNRIGSSGLLDPSCITTRFAADAITPLGPDYTGCTRLNSNVASVVIRGNDGHSSFKALQLRLDSQRISRWGLEFGVNYTWSHSIDNRSVSGLSSSVAETGRGYLDALHPNLDRGDSDFDVRHRVASHYIWEIPVGWNAHDWKGRYVFGGWEISGLLSYQTGQPFSIGDSGVPDLTGGIPERTRPRLTGALPHSGSLIPDEASPNSFLYLPINPVYDASGMCMAHTAPFACQISVNGPFDGTLPRNTFRQPGLYFQDTAFMKNLPLPREGMKMQFRAEFFNLLNHPNLYVNAGTNDVNSLSFTSSTGQRAPGVTASFKNSRQIVLALKLLF